MPSSTVTRSLHVSEELLCYFCALPPSFTAQQTVLLLAISRAAWPELHEAQKQDSGQEVIADS